MANEQFPDGPSIEDVELMASLVDDIAPYVGKVEGFLPQERCPFGAVSTLVCHAECIGGANKLYDTERARLDEYRKQGRLRPELMRMSPDTFRVFGDQITSDLVANIEGPSLDKLPLFLGDLERVCGQITLQNAVQLSGVLGVTLTGKNPERVPRDDARAAEIVRLAKRMDTEYMGVVALNPGFASTEDLESLTEIMGPRDPRIVDFLLRLNKGEAIN